MANPTRLPRSRISSVVKPPTSTPRLASASAIAMASVVFPTPGRPSNKILTIRDRARKRWALEEVLCSAPLLGERHEVVEEVPGRGRVHSVGDIGGAAHGVARDRDRGNGARHGLRARAEEVRPAGVAEAR